MELGYASKENPKGCLIIWNDPNVTSAEIHKSLTSYSTKLDNHTAAIKNFKPISDLLKSIVKTGNHDIGATTTRPHPDGLKALFPSNQLSLTDFGYVEPLFSPMRSTKICNLKAFGLMSLDYLVHDFEHMLHQLRCLY